MKELKKIQVILFRNPSKPEFLLLRTSPKRSMQIWQGITGGVEPSDKNLRGAALRELKEELNINAVENNLLGPIHEFQFTTDRKGYEGTIATEYCFAYELPHNFQVKLSDEHDACKWLNFEEAVKLIDFDNPKKTLQKANEKLITEF